MKLLYIANVRLPTEKAHGIQIMKMCEAFADAGCEVSLVVPRRRNEITTDPFLYYRVPPDTFRITRLPCIDAVRFGRVGFLLQAFSFAKASALYARIVRSDMVYTRDIYTAFYLRMFLKPYVLELHTKPSNVIARTAVRGAQKVVAISGGLAAYCRKECGVSEEKVLIAPDGFDPKEYRHVPSVQDVRERHGIPRDTFVVGYVGKLTTMGEEKGIGTLCRAFKAFQEEVPHALLLLVGANQTEVPTLHEMLATQGVPSDAVCIIPHIPHHEVPEYLALSDALVMNYPATEHYAHFMSPLKLFEYMAAEKPIVTTDLPSVREILDETSAFFVPPDDAALLAGLLVDIARNPKEAHVRATNAHARAECYTWRSRADIILATCRDTHI